MNHFAAIGNFIPYQNIQPTIRQCNPSGKSPQAKQRVFFQASKLNWCFLQPDQLQEVCGGSHGTAQQAGTYPPFSKPGCPLNSALTSYPGEAMGCPGLQRLMMTECSSCEELTRALEWIHEG